MKLAHAGDDGLTGLSSSVATRKGRILGGQTVEGETHLFLVGLGLRLDRDPDNRLGELHPLQDNRLQRIAERVTGGGLLEAGKRDDIAGISHVDVRTGVRVHLQHAADALALFLDRNS